MKKINLIQTKCLFKDIINNSVKLYGTFSIGKYKVSVYPIKKTTSCRVMALYNRRRKKGLCVGCGKIKVDKFVRCKKCRDKQNKQKKVRNKNG